MTDLRNKSYAAQLAASRDRLLARMEPVAEALPGCVAARDAKAVEKLTATKTRAQLVALVVILASWVAEAEARAAAKRGEAA